MENLNHRILGALSQTLRDLEEYCAAVGPSGIPIQPFEKWNDQHLYLTFMQTFFTRLDEEFSKHVQDFSEEHTTD